MFSVPNIGKKRRSLLQPSYLSSKSNFIYIFLNVVTRKRIIVENSNFPNILVLAIKY